MRVAAPHCLSFLITIGLGILALPNARPQPDPWFDFRDAFARIALDVSTIFAAMTRAAGAAPNGDPEILNARRESR